MGSLNLRQKLGAMRIRIFDFVQWRFEVARKDWADCGGRWNYFRVAFWAWLYGLQKVPGVHANETE